MKVSVAFRDDSEKFRRALVRARRQGLIASARVMVRAVKRGLRGGYTTGDFVTGNVQNSVTHSQPSEIGDGEYEILVGTNVKYAVYWEVGWRHYISGKFYRVPIWEQAFIDTQQAASDEYTRVVERELGAKAK